MKIQNPYLNTLAGKHDKVLVFDCEFWHVYDSKGFIPTKPYANDFYLPREIGGFFFTRSADGNWIYKKHFFVTFGPPKQRDVSFVSSHFSNVSEKTAKKMDEYQYLLKEPAETAYLATLPEEYHDLLKEDIDIYLDDKNIKTARRPVSWFRLFMEQYKDCVIVVKGPLDIVALKNMCTLHDISYSSPKKIVDIADWNPESHRICGSAKLENTFTCIGKDLDPSIRELAKLLPIDRPHDPTTDASMTFIIALYIIQTQ
jgi:hypothetical protein